MKRALFNANIGPEKQHWQKCMKSQNNYCKKYGIDHYISRKPVINLPWIKNWLDNMLITDREKFISLRHLNNNIYDYEESRNMKHEYYDVQFGIKSYNAAASHFEKYQCLSLFDKGYDQVLYLDCDILITPEAENIFDTYNETDTFYAYDESHDASRTSYISDVLQNNIDITWKKNKHSKYEYYNGGVQLYGKNSIDHIIDREKFISLNHLNNIYNFGDQTYINTLLQKYNVKTKAIDFVYNRMCFRDRDLDNKRYSSNFIHYSGPCIYGLTDTAHLSTSGRWRATEESKVKGILTDYKTLYE